ncbi:MAG: tetratricopeptide repeat protein [Candidatus Velamenicoccus archaeovorus]
MATRVAAAIGVALTLLAIGAATAVPRAPDEVPSGVRGRDGRTAPPLLLAGDPQRAIEQLQARLRAFPEDERAEAALGLAYVQQARVTSDPTLYPLAERALRRALASGGDRDADALVGMGTLALARHDFRIALAWGTRARAIAPFDADVYGVIGDAQMELGRYPAAFRTFQAMVDTRPDLASYARVSYARELQGDVPGAVAAMRAALRAAGTPTDAAWASFQLGELAFGHGHVHRAGVWYRRAAELVPTYVPARAGLAKLAWARGHLETAIARYREVVSRYPAPEHVIALADLYRTVGRPHLAERTRDLVRAEERLFRSNGVDTDLELALFEADHRRTDRALRTARAEWRRRRSIHVADALAWSLSQTGHDRAAARVMRRAMVLGTPNALFLFHDAMIRLRLGHHAEAASLLRRALAINPNFSILYRDRARSLLRRLEAGR